jgi:hypothetical protein
MASVGTGSRHAAEADAEEVAVDGDAAVVGLAGVFAYVVAELVERVVRGFDDGCQDGISREVANFQ